MIDLPTFTEPQQYRIGMIALSASLVFAACSNTQNSALDGQPDSVATAPEPFRDPELTAEFSEKAPIAERMVLYVEATASQIEAARRSMSEQDFAVIADDLMYYRSSAVDWLEAWPIPYTRMTGRRALYFMVNDLPQRIDFQGVPTLDFVVVYLPNQIPRTFAPNDIAAVRAYWHSAPAVELDG